MSVVLPFVLSCSSAKERRTPLSPLPLPWHRPRPTRPPVRPAGRHPFSIFLSGFAVEMAEKTRGILIGSERKKVARLAGCSGRQPRSP